MRRIKLFIIIQFLISSTFGLNVTIIESQSYLPGHDMDVEWSNVISGMGHTALIVPQSTLDTINNLINADILIISSGIITLPPNRVIPSFSFFRVADPFIFKVNI